MLFTNIISLISLNLQKKFPSKKRKYGTNEKYNSKTKYETIINFTDVVKISIKDVLYSMICENHQKNSKIIFLLRLILKCITYVVPDRSNVRHAIIFKGKWYFIYK